MSGCREGRFWKSENSHDKLSAYQTLYQCLDVVSRLISPVSPFYAEQLYRDLNNITSKNKAHSVHLGDFPKYQETMVDKELEERMEIAQNASSLILSLRKKENIRVRQPLQRIMIPVPDEKFRKQVEAVKSLILSETNIKEIEYIDDKKAIIVKKIKLNFKLLGPKYGALMKKLGARATEFTQEEIIKLENEGHYSFEIDGQAIELNLSDVEIFYEDIPGWLVANTGRLTVALDISITDDLKKEGYARELVNKIQNLRKQKDFEVTDHISVEILKDIYIETIINQFKNYICTETLTDNLNFVEEVNTDFEEVELENLKANIRIIKK